MIKFLKSVFNKAFNDVKVNLFIVAVLLIFSLHRWAKIGESTKNHLEFGIILEILVFFVLNLMMLEMKNYQKEFATQTRRAIFFFVVLLIMIIRFSGYASFVSLSPIFYFMVFVWSIYINYCIRMLNSFNVKCGTFVATSIKAMLIATTAWFSIDGKSQTSSVNIIISFISTLYPILDMYTYAYSKIDEFDKKEKEKKKFDFYNYN